MKLAHTLRERLASLVEAEGLELLDIEIAGSGAKTVMRLVVDGPAGVTLDQCAGISREASALLDVEEPFTHSYTLQVSSPGLDRKFYSQGDYRRFAGRRVKIRMRPEYRECRSAKGELLGLENGLVRLAAESGDILELPLQAIFEARLEIDWNAVMHERKCRR
ncbi:MAG: ribosome maturation factor RimP [Acidobacteria bacterium]|nr:ribosome maturation factor RimP [Acidobacteriota bacterium]